ncbi:MAG: hypothetical protein MZV63_58025 [Marinilabiliales bacterium]|nr:hypothetical protein [Marinilabiliales bacterium]
MQMERRWPAPEAGHRQSTTSGWDFTSHPDTRSPAALAYLGICVGDHDSPNDGKGIGRHGP